MNNNDKKHAKFWILNIAWNSDLRRNDKRQPPSGCDGVGYDYDETVQRIHRDLDRYGADEVQEMIVHLRTTGQFTVDENNIIRLGVRLFEDFERNAVSDRAERAAEAVYRNLSDRRGIRQALEDIDDEAIVAELKNSLASIIQKEMGEGETVEADPRIESVSLNAWVGEDELGSGRIGLKSALVPAGLVPIVMISDDARIQDPAIVQSLQAQSNKYGKTIRLCRFKFETVLQTLEPQECLK